ncbi:hypothetical protein GCM10028803_53330 [Larkinella knui]|uniref:Uncharacterized protein n=1 Tax=Larkinella knui TaxID=2025310 RepID=A0A3P1CGU3_9BACT|nr:hypothetical protein [Larkinella knui]RRB12460.1 hypothetical protein EHT87_19875 [Larkinella knui]
MSILEQQLGGWQQQPSVGHVARLKLVSIDDVLSVTTPDELPVAGRPLTVASLGLSVVDGAVMTELVFPPRTCTFTESTSRQAGQVLYTIALSTSLVAPDETLLTWLNEHLERRFLAIWLGHNGKVYQAGEIGNGLWMITGRGLTEQDSLSLTLQGLATHPVWYRDSYTETLPPDAEFDLSFDLSFS